MVRMMTHVQRVFATVNVVASHSVQRALRVRVVVVVRAQVVRAQVLVAAVRQQVRHHAVTASLADVLARMQVRVRGHMPARVLCVAAQVQRAPQVTAATTGVAHAQAQVLARPVPIVHVAQPFFPSNLTDNRLARPACKICHHEYLN